MHLKGTNGEYFLTSNQLELINSEEFGKILKFVIILRKFKILPNSSELINSSKFDVKRYPKFLYFKCILFTLNSSLYKKDITIWIFSKNLNNFKFPPTEGRKAKMNIHSVTPRVRPNSRKNMNAIRHWHLDTLPCQQNFF